MEVLAIYLLVAVNIGLTIWYFRINRQRPVWLLPTTYAALLGFLHYPLRALLLQLVTQLNLYELDSSEVALALSYYTVFIGVVLGGYTAALKRVSQRPAETQTGSDEGTWGIFTVFVMIAAAVAYRFATGRVYVLYDEARDLEAGAIDNVAGILASLRWLFIPWASIIAQQRRRKRKRCAVVLLGVVAVVLSLVGEAVISTSKGQLAGLAIISLALASYSGRRIPRVGAAVAASILLAFGLYSYLARAYGTVRGDFSVATLQDTMDNVVDNVDHTGDVGVVGAVNRFSYLDGLSLTMRQGIEGTGPYAAGSLVELVMLLPRGAWPDRPHLSFNHYVTGRVWGLRSFSETPIGRVGESYFTLGWGGLVYAIAYVFIFVATSRQLLFRNKPSVRAHALYIFVLYTYLVPDAYLTYGIKNLVYVAPAIVVAWCAALVQRRVAASRGPTSLDWTSERVKYAVGRPP